MNGIHRGSYFMRHIGQKAAFCFISSFSFFLGRNDICNIHHNQHETVFPFRHTFYWVNIDIIDQFLPAHMQFLNVVNLPLFCQSYLTHGLQMLALRIFHDTMKDGSNRQSVINFLCGVLTYLIISLCSQKCLKLIIQHNGNIRRILHKHSCIVFLTSFFGLTKLPESIRLLVHGRKDIILTMETLYLPMGLF